MGNAYALDPLDGCGRAIIDEADQLANISAGNGLVAVAIGDGQHGADQTAEIDAVIGVAGIGMTQGLVLDDTENAGVRVDGNGERSVTVGIATDHQAILYAQSNGTAAGGGETGRLRALFAVAAFDQRQGIDGGGTIFVGAEVIVGHDRRSGALRVGAHVGRRVGDAIEHRQRTGGVVTVRLQAGALIEHHIPPFAGELQAGAGAIVVDGDGQRHSGRNVTVEVEHAHAEIIEQLIGGPDGIGVAVIQAVVGQGVGPVARSIKYQNTVSALHGAAARDVDPVAAGVQHLDAPDAIG